MAVNQCSEKLLDQAHHLFSNYTAYTVCKLRGYPFFLGWLSGLISWLLQELKLYLAKATILNHDNFPYLVHSYPYYLVQNFFIRLFVMGILVLIFFSFLLFSWLNRLSHFLLLIVFPFSAYGVSLIFSTLVVQWNHLLSSCFLQINPRKVASRCQLQKC